MTSGLVVILLIICAKNGFNTGNDEEDSSYLQVKLEIPSEDFQESKAGFLDDSSNKCYNTRVKVEISKEEFEENYSSECATSSSTISMKITQKRPLRRKIRIGRWNNLAELQQAVIDGKSIECDLENKSKVTSHFVIRDKLCRFCDVKFRIARHYEQHFKDDHANSNPYVCLFCPFQSKARHKFFTHIRNEHPDQMIILSRKSYPNQIFSCQVCQTKHRGVKELEKHNMSQHKGMQMIHCGLCTAKFTMFRNLSFHEMKEHGMHDAEFQCEFCRNTFYRTDGLKDHVGKCRELHVKKKTGIVQVIAMEERWRMCDECGEKFKRIVCLKKHVQNVHPELKGSFTCNVCQKQYFSLQGLEAHTNRIHGCEPDNKIRRCRRNQTYTCQYCGEVFQGLTKFESHGLTAHGNDKKLFSCAKCGRGFTRRKCLERHVVNVHLGGESNISCTFCGADFPDHWRKKRHEKFCQKSHQRKGIEGLKDYFCELCDKNIRGTGYMWRSHKKSHKRYDYCKYCNLRFHSQKSPASLADHILKTHPNQLEYGKKKLPHTDADTLNFDSVKRGE